MTRKDFVLIAAALNAARPIAALVASELPVLRQAWANTCLTMARRLADENPRFDRVRFERACGLDL